jgi:hypothetical protein
MSSDRPPRITDDRNFRVLQPPRQPVREIEPPRSKRKDGGGGRLCRIRITPDRAARVVSSRWASVRLWGRVDARGKQEGVTEIGGMARRY